MENIIERSVIKKISEDWFYFLAANFSPEDFDERPRSSSVSENESDDSVTHNRPIESDATRPSLSTTRSVVRILWNIWHALLL